MKRMFCCLALVIAGLFSGSDSYGQLLFSETFDDATGFTTSTAFFSDGGSDFFGLAGGVDDYGADTVPTGVSPYTGFSGGFLTGEDLDGEGAELPITVEFLNINIAGQTNLVFSGEFAEFFDDPGDIDATEQLFVEAQIDGGGFAPILTFTPGSFTSGTSNGFFELGASTLGNAAQTFAAPISGTGSTLDLRLVVSLNAGDEDFAVDNFTVTAIPEPGSMVLLGMASLGMVFRRRR